MGDIRSYLQPSVLQVHGHDQTTSSNMPSEGVLQTVNEELSKQNTQKKRKSYAVWKPSERIEIAKYAKVHGCSKAEKHFKARFPDLTRQTANNFVKKLEALHAQSSSGGASSAEADHGEIISLKRGRKPILPEKVIDDSLTIIEALRAKGAVLKGNVIKAVVAGVLRSKYPGLTPNNFVSSETPRQMMHHMLVRKQIALVRRKGTTAKLPIPVGVFKEILFRFQTDINRIVVQYKIPAELIVNHDQTPITYVSQSSRTLAEKGAKQVPIAQSTNRKQITGNLAVTATGEILPMQLIYQGKTKACLPKTKFPDGFHVTMTPNHWSNETTCKEYVEKILDPYFVALRKSKGLPEDQTCLVVSDVFKAQQTDAVKECYETKNIKIVQVKIFVDT
jgi:hypothetical protein